MLTRTLAELEITDEKPLEDVDVYWELKDALLESGYRFRVLPSPAGRRGGASWSDVTLLNLGFWRIEDQGDVLARNEIPADVVAHVAWHHLAAAGLAGAGAAGGGLSLLLAESIASAFDFYLVGRLLPSSRRSEFLDTQVTAMAEVASEAGVTGKRFEKILERAAADPEAAFASLRELLFDTAAALYAAPGIDEAAAALDVARAHPYFGILHHYNLANWNLYARAYGSAAATTAKRALAADRAMREAPSTLAWLTQNWLGRFHARR